MICQRAELLTGFEIPYSDSVIPAGGGELFALGVKRDCEHRRKMSEQGVHFFAGRSLPDLDFTQLVRQRTCRGDMLTVGAEGDAKNPITVASERKRPPPAPQVVPLPATQMLRTLIEHLFDAAEVVGRQLAFGQ